MKCSFHSLKMSWSWRSNMAIKIKILKEGKGKKNHYSKQDREVLNRARDDYYIIPKDKLRDFLNGMGYYTPDEILSFIAKVQKATSGS